MLLAIDTTAGTSVAVVDRDRGVLIEVSDPNQSGHALAIGALIKRALELTETDPALLSGVAVGTGPGARHLIDVGIAAANGFAAALGKPVVRVLSHDAVMLDDPTPAVVMTAVGDGLTAWTPYGVPDEQLGLPRQLAEPTFATTEGLESSGIPVGVRRVEPLEISAGAIGMLAERLFAGGRSFARREPYYAGFLS